MDDGIDEGNDYSVYDNIKHKSKRKRNISSSSIEKVKEKSSLKKEKVDEEDPNKNKGEDSDNKNLQTEKLKPRTQIPPLLSPIDAVPPPLLPKSAFSNSSENNKNYDFEPQRGLHWLGTSFGLTQELFNYWSKSGFVFIYFFLILYIFIFN
jgi:N-acetyltransferase 10